MVKNYRGLLSFMKNRRDGYILLPSILFLLCICGVMVWQYHYYAAQWQLENQLTNDFIVAVRRNLTLDRSK